MKALFSAVLVKHAGDREQEQERADCVAEVQSGAHQHGVDGPADRGRKKTLESGQGKEHQWSPAVGADISALACGVPTAPTRCRLGPMEFAHKLCIRVGPPSLPCSPFAKRVLSEPTEAIFMPATLIEYEVIKAGPEMADVKRALNTIGRRGFRVCHTRVNSDGVYIFVLSKDTCLLYTSPSPRDRTRSRMPSSA